LAIYDDQFETAFLIHTREEFSKKAKQWSQECNCTEYLTKVAQAIEKEEENADYWL